MALRASRDIFLPSQLPSAAAIAELRSELRMDETTLKTFVTSHDKVRFTVLDLFADAQVQAATSTRSTPDQYNTTSAGLGRVQEHRCSSNNASQVISHANPDARARIISIRANASTAPLNITFPLMSQIFSQYGIEEEFWEIIRCFGSSPHPAEGGCTHAFARTYSDGSRSFCYDLQYMDDNLRRGDHANPWSQRHTGIYQRTIPAKDGSGREFDLIIALHPSMNTRFEQRIHSLATKPGADGTATMMPDRNLASRTNEDPSAVHEVLLETYLSNWRYFLRAKGDEFQTRLDTLFTMESDIKNVPDQSLGFEAVQQFRHLRDQILTAAAFCRGNMAVIQLLKDLHERHGQPGPGHISYGSSALHERVRGYISGLDALQGRIDNSIALLEYSLELKHQELAKESNRHMEELTHSTVDDSATVRTITILGLVYLPGTFVSGLFGMNFFDYDDDTNYMVIATNFWIYVLLWLGFTGITYGLYRLAEARRKKRGEMPSQQGDGLAGSRRRTTTTLTPSLPPSIGRMNMRAKGLSGTWRRNANTASGATATTTGSAKGEKPSLLPTTNVV